MTFERIITAARNSRPTQKQINEWNERDRENARLKTWDYYHPSTIPRSALTGWAGRTINIDDIRWSHAYAEEQGYSDTARGILFANWNDVSQRVQDILERAGYSLEWQDEWTTCSNCSKALRTKPDSYDWQPSFVEFEAEELCMECFDAGDYLESLENNPRRALNIPSINPADYGYRKLKGDYENGFHPGQDDNPQAIYHALRDAGHKRLLFQIDEVSQFYIGFAVWTKSEPLANR